MSDEPTRRRAGSDGGADDRRHDDRPTRHHQTRRRPTHWRPTNRPPSSAVTVPAMTPRRSIARDLALMAVVFVAVFILLAGLLWLAVPSAERGATRASPNRPCNRRPTRRPSPRRPDVSCPSMSTDQARVVVIGGGITGCSVAYHLAAGRLDRRPARREGAADGRLDLPGGGPRDGVQPVVDDDGLPALQHRAVRAPRRLRDASAACAWHRARTSCASSSGPPAGRAGSGSTPRSSAPTRRAG